MHDRVSRIAVALLRGAEIRFRDEHGRRWTATENGLACFDAPIIEGDAFDVALEVVRRGGDRQRYVTRISWRIVPCA